MVNRKERYERSGKLMKIKQTNKVDWKIHERKKEKGNEIVSNK